MGNRDDDRDFRSSMHNAAGGPDRSGPPRDGYEREGGFLREDRFGHTPGQRWSGGYGGDRDRYPGNAPPSNLGGRGFTGSDFQGSRDYDERARHFGNAVDRGGRMGSREEGSVGYGFHGTDMGMGAPEVERGPHYGKGPKGYKRSDERTRDDVCDAIAHFGYVDASDVEVKVEDGIVTLSGTVWHRRDKRALEHVIERCRGVHDIHIELRVKREDTQSGQKREDAKIASSREDESRDGSKGNHENGKAART